MEVGDPFEALYGQVRQSLSALEKGRREVLLESESARSTVRNELGSLQWDVQDLKEAVSVAAEDPSRFGLSDIEVARRQGLVDALEKDLRTCEAQVASTPAASNSGAENREKKFAQAENDMQVQLVREQDEQLDDLAVAVERIGAMGKTMHSELQEQGSMLEELEEDFDGTRGRMGDAHARLNRFMKETSRGQLCTIVALVALFLFLAFLLVVT